MLLFKKGNSRTRRINKLRREYQQETQEYFNPDKSTFISKDYLIKIFSGQVLNPNRQKNPESCPDYSYLVVCNIGLDELSEDKQHVFEGEYQDLFMKSQWFACFSTGLESAITIPKRGQILFQPQIYIRTIQEEFHFYAGSDFQYDHILDKKILTTDISLENMIKLLKNSFEQDIDKELGNLLDIR